MSTPAAAVAARRSRRGLHGRRLDALDGLRTVAVLLVLAYHVGLPGLRGGFLGVDVFFVLSGFLITSLLLRELTARGRIDLATFWMRRVLRLMPAALLVILTVVAWGAFVAPPFRREGLGADALWSILYVGNWRFISTSSYFADDGTQSPLQHVWSLAVEEQFYVAWPLLLGLAGLLLLTRSDPAAPLDSVARNERTESRRRRIGGATLGIGLVLAVASAALMWVLYDPAGPDRAYMGTDTKAFEPLLGALAAVLMTRTRVRAGVARHSGLLLVLGLAGVAAGVLFLGDTHAPAPAYFHGGAVGFAIACAVVVAAASVADRRRGVALVLGSSPMAYVGRISYGVYLWHWPLAVWIIQGHGFSPRRAALVVASTFLVAALSYHLVEMPIRTGKVVRLRPLVVLPRAGLAMAASILVAAMLGGSPLNRVVPALAAGSDGDEPTVVVVGDSVVRRLTPVLAPVAQERGVTVLDAARGGCPAIGVNALDGSGHLLAKGACASEVPRTQSEMLAEARPDLVVWWSRYELADRYEPDGTRLVAGTPRFWEAQQRSFEEAARRLTATGATLVVVEIDRTGLGMDSRCTPGDCDPFLDRLRNDDALRVEWNRMVRREADRLPNVETVRMDDVYCRDDAAPCDDSLPVRSPGEDEAPPPNGTGYARPDGSHFAEEAKPAVSEALLDRVARVTGADLGGR